MAYLKSGFNYRTGCRFSVSTMVIAAIFIKERRAKLFIHLRENLKYLGFVVLLLIVAAGVEAYITSSILRLLNRN